MPDGDWGAGDGQDPEIADPADGADGGDLADPHHDQDIPPACGNGIVEAGEQCDGQTGESCTTDGGLPGSRSCGLDCTWTPCCAAVDTCGNGLDDDCNALVDDADFNLVVQATPLSSFPCSGFNLDERFTVDAASNGSRFAAVWWNPEEGIDGAVIAADGTIIHPSLCPFPTGMYPSVAWVGDTLALSYVDSNGSEDQANHTTRAQLFTRDGLPSGSVISAAPAGSYVASIASTSLLFQLVYRVLAGDIQWKTIGIDGSVSSTAGTLTEGVTTPCCQERPWISLSFDWGGVFVTTLMYSPHPSPENVCFTQDTFGEISGEYSSLFDLRSPALTWFAGTAIGVDFLILESPESRLMRVDSACQVMLGPSDTPSYMANAALTAAGDTPSPGEAVALFPGEGSGPTLQKIDASTLSLTGLPLALDTASTAGVIDVSAASAGSRVLALWCAEDGVSFAIAEVCSTP